MAVQNGHETMTGTAKDADWTQTDMFPSPDALGPGRFYTLRADVEAMPDPTV